MADNIVNCSRCRRLFVKIGTSKQCPQCLKEVEEEFTRCAAFLRENPSCTLLELSESAEVDIKQITRFIQEGRLLVRDGSNIQYPCSVCGQPIQSGKYCAKCQKDLSSELQGAIPTKTPPAVEAKKTSDKGYSVIKRRTDNRN